MAGQYLGRAREDVMSGLIGRGKEGRAMCEARRDKLTNGIWLIGLGLLFYTGRWWPGIMFVIGVGSIAQGLAERRGWHALQGGIWSIAIGVWALYHFNIAVFFVGLGVSMVVLSLVRPPAFAKPKPFTDHTFE